MTKHRRSFALLVGAAVLVVNGGPFRVAEAVPTIELPPSAILPAAALLPMQDWVPDGVPDAAVAGPPSVATMPSTFVDDATVAAAELDSGVVDYSGFASVIEEVADGSLDPYALYDSQRVCEPSAKRGTLWLRDLLLTWYPASTSMGISRDCTVGGASEHKEGRAIDWGVSVADPVGRAAAEDFIGRLLATDADGRPHALARRLGVMYLIWDNSIWSAERAREGWRPYFGPNAHTDHVHISLSWAGGLGLTSFWSGQTDLPLPDRGTLPPAQPVRALPRPVALPPRRDDELEMIVHPEPEPDTPPEPAAPLEPAAPPPPVEDLTLPTPVTPPTPVAPSTPAAPPAPIEDLTSID